jgi:hypothetical protein
MAKMEEYGMEGEGSCPIATKDLTINLQNRGKAIEKADYGPMDPNLPNDEYWARMGSKWSESPENAKKMLCGNCSAFNQKSEMISCIEKGLSKDRMNDAMEVVDAGDLGFCEIFDFKCASKRTCAAWIVGGPLTDYNEDEEEYSDD